MQDSVCSFKLRTCKNLSKRNVNISPAIFKLSLCCRVRKFHKINRQISAIITLTENPYITALIKLINNRLLNSSIHIIIKRIDSYSLLKNLFKILANLRNRKCNNRKAYLIVRHIFLDYCPILRNIIKMKLALLIVKLHTFFLVLGSKRLLAENLYNCRPCILYSILLIILIRGLNNRQSPLNKCLIKIQTVIITMVIMILLIYL